MLRHCLDAVDAGAQIYAVEIKLENLIFRELRFDQDRDPKLAQLASVRRGVRKKRRARELLRERPPAFPTPARLDIAHHRACKPDRIDAGMMVEAAIFHRD